MLGLNVEVLGHIQNGRRGLLDVILLRGPV